MKLILTAPLTKFLAASFYLALSTSSSLSLGALSSSSSPQSTAGCTNFPTFPTPLVIEPLESPTDSTFIFLPGGGDTSQDEEAFATSSASSTSPDLSLHTLFPHTRFIFPQANIHFNTVLQINNTQWFDNTGLDIQEDINATDLAVSVEYVHRLIRQELQAEISPHKIVVGGISQGSVLAVYSVLTYNGMLAGCVGISGWFPFSSRVDAIVTTGAQDADLKSVNELRKLLAFPETESTAALHTPVFLGHGTEDSDLNITFGMNAQRVLQSIGVDVTWGEYPVGHTFAIPDELSDIAKWLKGKAGL